MEPVQYLDGEQRSSMRLSTHTLPRKPVPKSHVRSYSDSSEASSSLTLTPSQDLPTAPLIPAKRPRVGASRISQTIWLPEFFSVSLALLALAAVMILLAMHQDKPLPNWPSVVSVNSLVAIFTSILKVALLYPIAEGISELKWACFANARPLSDLDRFDAASRGPLGALQLLFTRSGTLLTSLGAAIIILALAIDPFAQQILQFYSCLSPQLGVVATIPRTNNYTSVGLYSNADQYALDAPMALALYEGLLNPPANVSSSLAFNCPSGNCTFAESNGATYRSLAVCYQVDDLTHLINGTAAGNYSLPSGISADSKGDLALSTDSTYGESQLCGFEAIMMARTCGDEPLNSTARCPLKPWAFGAYLYPCIQTYHSVSISQSVLHEELVSSIPLTPGEASMDGLAPFSLAGDLAPPSDDVDCTPSSQRGGNKTAPTQATSDGRPHFVDVSYGPEYDNATRGAQYFDPRCVYAYQLGSALALRYASASFFGGPLNTLHAHFGEFADAQGPAWLQTLYNGGDVDLDGATRYVQGLADALTANVRRSGDTSNSAPAQGVVLGSETCVGIAWGWLSLPAALVACALVFCAAAVAQTRRAELHHAYEKGGRRPPWKSSALPLLWCGLSDELRRANGTLDGVDQMRECSDRLYVRLKRTDVLDLQHPLDKVPEKRLGRWVLVEDVGSKGA